jgi:hypothetical protein
MGLLVLIVLAPALLKRFGLSTCWKAGNEVGMTCRNALLLESVGHLGDES